MSSRSSTYTRYCVSTQLLWRQFVLVHFSPLQKHARPPAQSLLESSFQSKLGPIAQQILYNMIYYCNAHKKPSTQFHYNLELYSICTLPPPLSGQLWPPLFQMRCGLNLKGFQFIVSQGGLRTPRTHDGWLQCSCQHLPLEYCFPWRSPDCSFKKRWHSSLFFMTSGQRYKAMITQSCTTGSTNNKSSYLWTRSGPRFQLSTGSRALFLRASWARRGGKSKGEFLPSHQFWKHSYFLTTVGCALYLTDPY